MKYLELRIETSEYGLEALTGALLSIGIENVQIDDPAEVRRMLDDTWATTEYFDEEELSSEIHGTPAVTLYFPDDEDGRSQAASVRAKLDELKQSPEGDMGSLELTMSVSDDADWKDKWKEFFKPTHVTNDIVVKPTWETYEPKDDEILVDIDPGMAFGTGTHQTTSLAIRMLDKYVPMVRSEKPEGDNLGVLDVGCGSGILSIVAAKLGADKVLGTDIDEDAVRVAKENIVLNGVADTASAGAGDLAKGLDFRADIVVANLITNLVIELSSDCARHFKAPGGIFITSGILAEHEDRVKKALDKAGFDIIEVAADGEWISIVGRLR